jgi:ubiquinone/menaquinone biosynthesis C-methylase UbiE
MSRSWEVWDDDHVKRLTSYGWASKKITKGAIVSKVLDETVGDRVLDVGCGVGRYAHFYQTMPVQYLGVDSSESMLAVARERYPHMRFEVGDVYGLDSLPMFDTVIAIALLIHMPNVEDAVRQMWSVAGQCLMMTVTMSEGGRVSENPTYTRAGKTTKFPPGKRIISRSEDPKVFERLLRSLNPSDVQSWTIGPVELYKVVR